MKKMLLVGVALFAVSACADNDAVEPEVDSEVAIEETTAPAEAEWTGFEPGNYRVEEGGETFDYTLNEDGSFSMTNAAGETVNGTMEMIDGKGCFSMEGEETMCWTNAEPGADGSWQATSDDGRTATVTPVTT